MCKNGNTIVLQLDNLKSKRRPEGKISVDKCIAPLIKSLNENGYDTAACCCGHGHRPTSIILKDDRRVIMLPNYETAYYVEQMFPYDINGKKGIWTLSSRERIRLLFTGRIHNEKIKAKVRAKYFKMLKEKG